jgi:hypothetical protein
LFNLETETSILIVTSTPGTGTALLAGLLTWLPT